MAVGLRRNPYNAQALFSHENEYAPQTGQQFLGLNSAGVETPEPVALIEPIAPAEMIGDEGAAQESGGLGDFVTEAQIEQRRRLAKALMGNQQEVNHPMQAIGNAVSQITGAWMESKAGREEQEAAQRRREAMQKAFGGDQVDMDTAMRQLAASGDPEMVDKFLEYQISKASQASKRGAFEPKQMIKGNDYVYVDENGQEVPGFGGPRYRDRDGGGGSGGGGNTKYQQVQMQLADGRVVLASYSPRDGKAYYQDDKGNLIPVPPDARPATASTGGKQSPSGWLKLKKEREEGINALNALDAYAEQAGSLPQGYRRWANEFSAKFKTFLGQQGLTPEQFDQLQAPAKQQALLGMLRTTIVGPGVMTEYDAQRVIQAMGGDPRSALQNPEVMEAILQDLYERKRRELNVLQQEYERNAPSFGEEPEPLPLPRYLGRDKKPKQQPGAAPKAFNDGEKRTINGKTYIRKGGRWYPA